MPAYRECLRSCIVVYRDIDGKVGVADLITQKIRSFAICIVLSNKIVVLRSDSVLVLGPRAFLQVSDPLSLDIRLASFPEVDV
jgi:hypothetical protein